MPKRRESGDVIPLDRARSASEILKVREKMVEREGNMAEALRKAVDEVLVPETGRNNMAFDIEDALVQFIQVHPTPATARRFMVDTLYPMLHGLDRSDKQAIALAVQEVINRMLAASGSPRLEDSIV